MYWKVATLLVVLKIFGKLHIISKKDVKKWKWKIKGFETFNEMKRRKLL